MNCSLVNHMIKHHYGRKQRNSGALLSGIIRLKPYVHQGNAYETLIIYECCTSTLLEMLVITVVQNQHHLEYRTGQIK
jgi:hypothetical protein